MSLATAFFVLTFCILTNSEHLYEDTTDILLPTNNEDREHSSVTANPENPENPMLPTNPENQPETPISEDAENLSVATKPEDAEYPSLMTNPEDPSLTKNTEDPEDPSVTTNPEGPKDPSLITNPGDAEDPLLITNPEDPEDPSLTTNPEDPKDSSLITNPGDAEDPSLITNPGDAENSSLTSNPEDPEDPSLTTNPEDPKDPSLITNPGDAEDPSLTSNPEDPEDPSMTTNHEDPKDPSLITNPGDAEDPSLTTNSEDPEGSSLTTNSEDPEDPSVTTNPERPRGPPQRLNCEDHEDEPVTVYYNQTAVLPFSIRYKELLFNYYADYSDEWFDNYFDGCKSIGSCNASKSNQPWKPSTCHCDEICSLYNDCCSDSIPVRENKPPTIHEILEPGNFECISLNTKRRTISGYFMITRCKNEFAGSEEERRCNIMTVRDKDTVPVITPDDIVFRNRHCAVCNNISEFRYFSLEYNGQTPGGSSLDQSIASDIISISSTISFTLVPPLDAKPRMCILGAIEKFDEPLCSLYQNPVLMIRNNTPILYRNIRCAAEVDPYFECFTGNGGRFSMYPLTVLVNFNDGLTSGKSGDKPCLLGAEELQGKCSDTFVFQNLILDYRIIQNNVVIANGHTPMHFSDVWSAIIEHYFVVQQLPLLGIVGDVFVDNDTCVKGKYLRMVILEPGFSYEEIAFIDAYMEQIVIELINGGNKVELSFTKSFCENFANNFLVHVYTDETDQDKLQLFTKCRHVQFSFDDAETENGIALTNTKHSCFIEKKQTMSLSNEMIFTILTYTCFGASLLSLVIAMIIHHKLKLPSSLPDSCLVHIMVLLALAMLVFMVGIGANDVNIICLSISAILHFLWLSVFSFQSISLVYLTIDIFLVTTRLRILRVPKRFGVCVGYVVPTFLVVVCLALALCDCTGLDIQYGNKICFPSGFHGSVVFFALPIMASLALNSVLLFALAIKLHFYAKSMASLTKDSASRNIGIFLRLTFSSGIFWVFELIKGVWDHPAMTFISICLNGLQGVFVMIIFLSSRQVRNRIKLLASSQSGSTEREHRKLDKVFK